MLKLCPENQNMCCEYIFAQRPPQFNERPRRLKKKKRGLGEEKKKGRNFGGGEGRSRGGGPAQKGATGGAVLQRGRPGKKITHCPKK